MNIDLTDIFVIDQRISKLKDEIELIKKTDTAQMNIQNHENFERSSETIYASKITNNNIENSIMNVIEDVKAIKCSTMKINELYIKIKHMQLLDQRATEAHDICENILQRKKCIENLINTENKSFMELCQELIHCIDLEEKYSFMDIYSVLDILFLEESNINFIGDEFNSKFFINKKRADFTSIIHQKLNKVEDIEEKKALINLISELGNSDEAVILRKEVQFKSFTEKLKPIEAKLVSLSDINENMEMVLVCFINFINTENIFVYEDGISLETLKGLYEICFRSFIQIIQFYFTHSNYAKIDQNQSTLTILNFNYDFSPYQIDSFLITVIYFLSCIHFACTFVSSRIHQNRVNDRTSVVSICSIMEDDLVKKLLFVTSSFIEYYLESVHKEVKNTHFRIFDQYIDDKQLINSVGISFVDKNQSTVHSKDAFMKLCESNCFLFYIDDMSSILSTLLTRYLEAKHPKVIVIAFAHISTFISSKLIPTIIQYMSEFFVECVGRFNSYNDADSQYIISLILKWFNSEYTFNETIISITELEILNELPNQVLVNKIMYDKSESKTTLHSSNEKLLLKLNEMMDWISTECAKLLLISCKADKYLKNECYVIDLGTPSGNWIHLATNTWGETIATWTVSLSSKFSEIFIDKLTKKICSSMYLFILKIKFNQLGGLQLDKDLNKLRDIFSYINHKKVRENFKLLFLITSLLTVTNIQDAKEWYSCIPLSSKNLLSIETIQTILRQRIDIPENHIQQFK